MTYIIIEIVIVVSRMNNDSARLKLKTTQIFKNKKVLTFFLDSRQTVFIGTTVISSESAFKEVCQIHNDTIEILWFESVKDIAFYSLMGVTGNVWELN